jgi:hypothetical protein
MGAMRNHPMLPPLEQDSLHAFQTALRRLVADPQTRAALLEAVLRLFEEACRRPQ